jgi:hypothetical protein
MIMTRFADQLFTDLMTEYSPTLADTELRPAARHIVPRQVWLAAGVVGMAGAITAGVAVSGGGTPAYAVTENPNGTVTISINDPSGIAAANDTLHRLGLPVVAVPARPDCPPIGSLPRIDDPPHRVSITVGGTDEGSVLVDARGLPADDIAVVAAQRQPDGKMSLAMMLTKKPAPACVSVPTSGVH